jgi:nitrogen regulatory protein PII
MKTTDSKVLTIITESIIEQKLVKCLKELGATGYTIEEVRGEGRRGVRRNDWDQSGSIRLQIVCEEQLAVKIAEHLTNNFMDSYAMYIFMFDAHVFTK